MVRLYLSTFTGVVLGLVIGFILGWGVFPVEYVDSPLSDLAQRWRDEYTVMVAGGYVVDGDLDAALERLRVLEAPNIPEYVQTIAERYITNSRDLTDIRQLVALAEGMGRLTPPMENFRQFSRTGADGR